MTDARFKVGDRVAVRSSPHLSANTVGTVVRVYTALREGYDVAYGDHCIALLWSHELDCIVDASPLDHVEGA
jgi:hypothetical protein